MRNKRIKDINHSDRLVWSRGKKSASQNHALIAFVIVVTLALFLYKNFGDRLKRNPATAMSDSESSLIEKTRSLLKH